MVDDSGGSLKRKYPTCISLLYESIPVPASTPEGESLQFSIPCDCSKQWKRSSENWPGFKNAKSGVRWLRIFQGGFHGGFGTWSGDCHSVVVADFTPKARRYPHSHGIECLRGGYILRQNYVYAPALTCRRTPVSKAARRTVMSEKKMGRK
jgi:hypothetical protein